MILNILAIILGTIIGIIGMGIMIEIRFKAGLSAYRKSYAAMVSSFVVFECLIGSVEMAAFLTFILIFVYICDYLTDRLKVKQYKLLQTVLSDYVESGWGNVYKANVLRGQLGRIWESIPEKSKQEILAWEKETIKIGVTK